MRLSLFLLIFTVFYTFADTPPPPPVSFIDSLVQSSKNVSLKNDSPSPGANQCYSTNSSGVLGWFTCTGGGGGGVSSVGLADGSSTPIYSISNSPVTSSGTLTFTLGTQTASKVFAGPSSGSASQPTFRSLVSNDLPIVNLAHGGTGSDLSATGGASQVLQQTTSGGVVTVGRLACANLSNSAASCSTDTTNASNISSGLLGIAEGGTNEGSQTANGIMYYDGTHITSGGNFIYDGSLVSRLVSQLIIQSIGTGASNANIGTASTGGTLVVGNVAGVSSIVSTASGVGNAVIGDATGNGQVSAQGNGSIDVGYATGAGIVATELDGSIAVGRADTSGQVSANGLATQAFGYADGGAITGASGSGSMVQGYSTGTSSTINTTSGKIGQIGGGYAATAGNISTAANGAISYGYADSTGTITASGDGGFAHGRSHGSGISLTASGIGSEALGYANSFSITASGNGSLAGGAPATAAVTASGVSAISWGDGNAGSGNLSLTTGLGNSNTTYAGIVGGRYASLSAQTATSWVASDYAIVYGNGTGSGAKSNAFSVTKNGVVTSSTFESANGAVGSPAHSFTADATSGMFLVGVGELGISVAGDQALDFQSDGVGDGNVGMGGPASLSASYPLLIQRTNASAGTFIQVANPTSSANANAAIQLSTDSNNLGNIGVYTVGSTVAPYINAMIVRPNGNTGHLSLIGGDQTSGDVQVYTGGDYTSTGETAVFNGDHTTTLFGALKINGSTSGTFTQNAAGTTSSYSVTWPSAQGTGALTDNGSGVLSWTAYQTALTFTSPLVNTTGTVSCNAASGSQAGCLSSTDWSTFNGKQSSLTLGNISDAGTDGISISGGTGAIIGSGVTVSQHVADTTHAGYLSSADWNTFSGKQSALTFSDSVVNSGGTVTLVNDSASPGNSMCYSTNSSGVLGWNACSSGGGSGTVTSITAGTGITLSPSPITTTGSVSLTVPVAIASGGTNSTSVTTAPAATVWAGWDANKNFQANNFFGNYATQATANTTTSLTVSSSQNLYFTGSTSGQKVDLPVASTLVVGMSYLIVNGSSQTVAIQTSAGTGIVSLIADQWGVFTCILASGTTAASWQFFYGYNAGTTGGLPASLGGTGVTSVTTAPFASSFAGWDANKNMTANAFITGFTTTATAAGTTSMTIASTENQIWTGSSTQIIKLPTTSVAQGAHYQFRNLSTGSLTIQSSGANTIATDVANAIMDCVALVATPTTAANWNCVSASSPLAPTVQKFLTTGTQTGWLFTVTGWTGTIVAGDTYTNNSNTYTALQSTQTNGASGQTLFMSGTGATSGTTLTKAVSASGPATITFSATTALATYTTPSPAPLYIHVKMIGGGGGGGSSLASGAGSNGSAGTGTFFGASLLNGLGGGGGSSTNPVVGGAGGTASLGTGPIGIAFTGGAGGGGQDTTTVGNITGGIGAASPFGGAGGGASNFGGGAAVANTGSGGSGGGGASGISSTNGGGGGAGGFVDATISSAAVTYPYVVGAGGSGGTAGAGNAGGAGASGIIFIEEYYQ